MNAITIGLDVAKHGFQVHVADAAGAVVSRRRLRRGEVETFFAAQPRCRVGIEACATSHHWGRVLRGQGHEVRLIGPSVVKRYVAQGSKNDATDAAAICEAASRASVRAVPIKSEAQQAILVVQGVRDLLVKQRTMLVNALRGHLAEFGMVAAQGREGLRELVAVVAGEDPRLPGLARLALGDLVRQIDAIEERIKGVEKALLAWHRTNADSRLLATIPGIGPITATALVAKVPDPDAFRSGRHLAAWIGLVPRQNSTGGKIRLGRITRRGDRELRRLLVNGATAVIRHLKTRPPEEEAWLRALIARRSTKLARVALANKMARIAWAVLSRKQPYRRPAPRQAQPAS